MTQRVAITLIDGLTMEHPGSFLRRDGTTHPW
jgi:hypothetical protein